MSGFLSGVSKRRSPAGSSLAWQQRVALRRDGGNLHPQVERHGADSLLDDFVTPSQGPLPTDRPMPEAEFERLMGFSGHPARREICSRPISGKDAGGSV